MPSSKKNIRFRSNRKKKLCSLGQSRDKKNINYNKAPTKSIRNSRVDDQQSIITLDETGRCSPMFLDEIRNSSSISLDATVDLSESDSSVCEVIEDNPLNCDVLGTYTATYFLPKYVDEIKGSIVYISIPENYGLLTFNVDDEFVLGVFSLDSSRHLLLGNEIVVNAWFSPQMANIHYMACICQENQPALSLMISKQSEERFYYVDKCFQFEKLNINQNRLIKKAKTLLHCEHYDSKIPKTFSTVPEKSFRSDNSINIPQTISKPVTSNDNFVEDIPEETVSLPSTSTKISGEDLCIGTEHEKLKVKKENSVNLSQFRLDTKNGSVGKVLKNIDKQCWFALVFDGDKKIFEVIFDECDVVDVTSPGSKTVICKPGAFIKLNSVGCNEYFKSSCHIATFVILGEKLEDIIHKKIAPPDRELLTLKNMSMEKINYSRIALRMVKESEYNENEIVTVKEVQKMATNSKMALPDVISQESGIILQVCREFSVIKFSVNDGEANSTCFAIFDDKCKIDTSVQYKFGDLVNFNAVKSSISDHENFYVVYRVYGKIQTGKNNYEKILECSEFLKDYNTSEEFEELDWKASKVQIPDVLSCVKSFSVTIKKVTKLNKKICLAKLKDSNDYGLLVTSDKGNIIESMSMVADAVILREYGLLRHIIFPRSTGTSKYAYLEHDCFDAFHRNVDIFEAVALSIDGSKETNEIVRKLLAAYAEETNKKIDIDVNGVEIQVMKPFSIKTIKEKTKTSLSYESLLFFFLLLDYKLFHSEQPSIAESEIQNFKDEGLSFNVLSQLQSNDILKVYNKRAFQLTSSGLLEDIPAITKWKLEHDQELIKACLYKTKHVYDLNSLVKDINSRFKCGTGIDQMSSFLEKRLMFLFELSMTRGRFFVKEERSLLENAIRMVIYASLTNLFGKIGLR